MEGLGEKNHRERENVYGRKEDFVKTRGKIIERVAAKNCYIVNFYDEEGMNYREQQKQGKQENATLLSPFKGKKIRPLSFIHSDQY